MSGLKLTSSVVNVANHAPTSSRPSLSATKFALPFRSHPSSAESLDDAVPAATVEEEVLSSADEMLSEDEAMLFSDDHTPFPSKTARSFGEDLAIKLVCYILVEYPGNGIRWEFDRRPESRAAPTAEEQSRLHEDALCLARNTGSVVTYALCRQASKARASCYTRPAREAAPVWRGSQMLGARPPPLPDLPEWDSDDDDSFT